MTETSQKAITGQFKTLNGHFEVKEEPIDFYVSDVTILKQIKNIKNASGHFSGILCFLNQLSYRNKVVLLIQCFLTYSASFGQETVLFLKQNKY